MRYVPGMKLDWAGSKHRFADLMELYETNYRLLARLIPRIDEVAGHEVSSVEACLDLHLRVVERHKYTTILSLTYLFDREEGPVAEPGMELRLYHDARMAEVAECGACDDQGRGPDGAHGRPEVLERKWSANLFLEKWLAYCLERGHRFPAGRGGCSACASRPALAEG